ncbi:hypothetical protein GDO86_014191 [Hymenochirus boettgeri]|uniref:Uncharacterized protein n=1 Tax=Hymenochirus boettgeri TaxID=247094 RepID=A0A8T2JWB8_9PIPI|nr:hypothetical protein GDO86_014191 [Hymenochirus boettgeri]
MFIFNHVYRNLTIPICPIALYHIGLGLTNDTKMPIVTCYNHENKVVKITKVTKLDKIHLNLYIRIYPTQAHFHTPTQKQYRDRA